VTPARRAAASPFQPRLTQIGAPIYSVSCDPGFRARFVKFLGDQADEQRAERPQAVIVEAIRQLAGGAGHQGRCE
jgi:hypothetical protein